VVAQVGTDLHTTSFDSGVAGRLYARVAGLGSLIKGHYTDEVDHRRPTRPRAWGRQRRAGVHGSGVRALRELERPGTLRPCQQTNPAALGHQEAAIEQAVVSRAAGESGCNRRKAGSEYLDLPAERRQWLVRTGARYIGPTRRCWSPARTRENLGPELDDPHGLVVERIAPASANTWRPSGWSVHWRSWIREGTAPCA
jgi:hypothetical protein